MTWVLDLAKCYEPPPTERLAGVFGVILYTRGHPHIKKALEDTDYWAALDELSGPRWPIFATVMASGRQANLPGSSGLSAMMPVWEEPEANRELLELFEISDSKKLPLLVVFAMISDDEVLRTVAPLSDTDQLAAFKSLKEVVITVADAIDNLMKDDQDISETEVLAGVSSRLRKLGYFRQMRSAYRLAKEVKRWMSIV